MQAAMADKVAGGLDGVINTLGVDRNPLNSADGDAFLNHVRLQWGPRASHCSRKPCPTRGNQPYINLNPNLHG